MPLKGIDLSKDVQILKKLHPKADIYLLRIAAGGGAIMIVQILWQISTAIGLLK
jgi:hypothetical protein